MNVKASGKRRPYSTSIRLSERGREDLRLLSAYRRISQTDTIEQLIAEAAERVRSRITSDTLRELTGRNVTHAAHTAKAAS